MSDVAILPADPPLTVSAKQAHEYVLPTAALALSVSASGERIVVGCLDGVYEVGPKQQEPKKLAAHRSYVSGVWLIPDESKCISAGYDGAIQWLDLTTGQTIRTVQAHRFWSWQSALSADGKLVASVSGQYLAGGEKYEPAADTEPTVKVFSAESGEQLHAFPHLPPVQSVAFSPDGTHLAAGNLMGEVRIWNLQTGQLAAEWKTDAVTSWGIIKSHCYIGGIYSLRFTPDGRELLLCGMGAMRDPMAGNGDQTWQRLAWTEQPPKLAAQIGLCRASRPLHSLQMAARCIWQVQPARSTRKANRSRLDASSHSTLLSVAYDVT
jgi:WD40 repeat protein